MTDLDYLGSGLPVAVYGVYQLVSAVRPRGAPRMLSPFSNTKSTWSAWCSARLLEALCISGVGAALCAFHLSIFRQCPNQKCRDDTVAHVLVGVAMFLGGILRYMLTSAYFTGLDVPNFSTALVLGLIGALVASRPSSEGGSTPSPYAGHVRSWAGGAAVLAGAAQFYAEERPGWRPLSALLLMCAGTLICLASPAAERVMQRGHMSGTNAVFVSAAAVLLLFVLVLVLAMTCSSCCKGRYQVVSGGPSHGRPKSSKRAHAPPDDDAQLQLELELDMLDSSL